MCGGLGVNSSRCLSFIFSIQALEEKKQLCGRASERLLLGWTAVYRDVASCFSLSMSARAWVSCS